MQTKQLEAGYIAEFNIMTGHGKVRALDGEELVFDYMGFPSASYIPEEGDAIMFTRSEKDYRQAFIVSLYSGQVNI